MNNVKVRIYELSRELNLENKDILAVCERLNISVKSHSSTITESDAERIQKYVASHPISAWSDENPDAAHQSHAGGAVDKKKQQILEIRRPNLIRPENQPSPADSPQPEPPAASVATPPKPPNLSESSVSSETNISELPKPNNSPQPPANSLWKLPLLELTQPLMMSAGLIDPKKRSPRCLNRLLRPAQLQLRKNRPL
ncbi:Translation initiation factor IF-2, N-terminal region [Limnospira platensis C1]|nr:Translation initiation factor IF-2, N-terminal region [Arthrospira platensis C1]